MNKDFILPVFYLTNTDKRQTGSGEEGFLPLFFGTGMILEPFGIRRGGLAIVAVCLRRVSLIDFQMSGRGSS